MYTSDIDALSNSFDRNYLLQPSLHRHSDLDFKDLPEYASLCLLVSSFVFDCIFICQLYHLLVFYETKVHINISVTSLFVLSR